MLVAKARCTRPTHPIRQFPPVALGLLLAGTSALAQTPAGLPRPDAALEAPRMAQLAVEMALGDGAALSAPERVVKGAPYCAEAVHENVQWLPEAPGATGGNRIVHKTSTRLCRDGEGRTRQEVDSGGRKLVYLADPVARENWVLDPEHKTARQIGGTGSFSWRGSWSGGIDSSAWRDYADRMRDWARQMAESFRPGEGRGVMPPLPTPMPPVPPMAPPAAAPAAPAAPPAAVAPAAPAAPIAPALVESMPSVREREVRILRFDGSAAVPPPEVRWRAQQLAPRGPGSVSSLGSKDIDGVRVNGERTTWTIEAGRLGNEKPIVMTREIWTSPELMLQVQSRDFDPRSGEVSYRLQNIRRGEPDATLMKVPAEYRVTRRSERRVEERREKS